jgi:hypothetical protein
METKFNFYDFVGYVIPGIITLLLIYWLLHSFFSFTILIPENLGSSIILLALSYFVGNLVQMIGSIYSKWLFNKWGGYFHDIYLDDADDYYSSSFKNEIKTYATSLFCLTPECKIEDKKNITKWRKELFNLCYSLVIQKGIGINTEVFNGFAGLFRGLIVTIFIGGIISVAIFAKQIYMIFLINQFSFPKLLTSSPDKNQLLLSILLLIFFFTLYSPVVNRYKKFSEHFVNSIYRNFYVWFSLENHR